ncbi:hypothetical protein A3849_04705 [Paenibacillus sp. P46E]|nr:hypothetical protein A3849_04705 [Paenibacillus sp. P46E]
MGRDSLPVSSVSIFPQQTMNVLKIERPGGTASCSTLMPRRFIDMVYGDAMIPKGVCRLPFLSAGQKFKLRVAFKNG